MQVFENVRSVITRCSNVVTLRSTGQNLSRSFVVLLRKNNPQNHNLQTAVEHGVIVLFQCAFLIAVKEYETSESSSFYCITGRPVDPVVG